MVIRTTFWTTFVVLLVELCYRYTKTGIEKVCVGMAGCKSIRRNPKEEIMRMACTDDQGHNQHQADAEESGVCISPDSCTLIRPGCR